MKKVFLVVVIFSFISTSSTFCWEYAEGDDSGNIIIYNPKGSVKWGHESSSGNIIMYDKKGNIKKGHTKK